MNNHTDLNSPTQKRIAVIGSGVAGLTSAYTLSKNYLVDLFESNFRIGGHTHTVDIHETPQKKIGIDTGFIVFNEKNYPNFIHLLNELNINYCDSDMSFSYTSENDNICYGSDFPSGIFAKKSNLLTPQHYAFLYKIHTFNSLCLELSDSKKIQNISLGEFLQTFNISKRVISNYIIPMTSAIWSASEQDALQFPMDAFVRFWKNHHLLSFSNRLTWKTIPNGAIRYINAILPKISGNIFTNTPVENIHRDEKKVSLTVKNVMHHYDAIVIATHADQALRLIESPTELETSLLSPWTYSSNNTVLHTDSSFMPPLRSAWSSWNVHQSRHQQKTSPASLTYWMNRLQPLPTQKNYFLTLNPDREIPENCIHMQCTNQHPIMNRTALLTQEKLPLLNSQKSPIFFCGSYFLNGFHEDAVRSALNASKSVEAYCGI